MKKFKEFKVRIDSNALKKACFYHAESLGLVKDNRSQPNDGYLYICNGEYGICADGSVKFNRVKYIMPLNEFFKLTPADVVVEPERYWVTLITSFQDFGKNKSCKLNQSQIDEIKAIMEREE